MYLDKLKLDARIAVVTGGGRNIGLACGQALAEAGATVIVTDLEQSLVDSGVAAIRAAGGKADGMVIDVTSTASVNEVAAEAIKRHGHVDILVCNAGIARSETPAEKVEDEHWLNVIDINLNGVFWCCRAFGKHMLERKKGAIVNIGSMSGFIVNKPQEQSYYNASKAGVHHLTRSLAAEWGARGVRVNAVAPTYIDTDMNRYVHEDAQMYRHWVGGTPMNRLGRVDEVASVVLFLASEASSLMTGSIVLADGGYVCW